jgi:hypothetical protein
MSKFIAEHPPMDQSMDHMDQSCNLDHTLEAARNEIITHEYLEILKINFFGGAAVAQR